ncbi:hypothetical protein SAMN04488557_0335 [Hyphomicrobium facile]|uniref:Uncharacterized protein n=1 Tax=Hyphomicrobium facile TaxID=51670 RepID=A0A1I7MUP9_9HYPH|nr:hypothetical protein SAMN04488557_0335 [Hyphomicrobium facile]
MADQNRLAMTLGQLHQGFIGPRIAARGEAADLKRVQLL